MEAVPFPQRWPFFGNVPQFALKKSYAVLNQMATQFPGIFDLQFPAGGFYVAYKHEYVAEFLDTERFQKVVDSALLEIRRLSGDGLFTAHTDEENWGLAHRILTPAFSMKNMRDYIPIMREAAQELLNNWNDRPGQLIEVSDDMTRYTLETIGRCGFGYSFQSFQQKELDPFVGAMVRSLDYSVKRGQMSQLMKRLTIRSNRQFERDCDFMNKMVDALIAERKADPKGKERHDLLSMMLHDPDRTSGRTLDTANIRYQLITFLIAGHETTSGLLSFALYLLMKHPEALKKAQMEVDTILGDDPQTELGLGEMARLRYVGQVLRESLRLYPTAPGFFVQSTKDQSIGGRYAIQANRSVLILLYHLHRDPEVWGQDAEKFDPDRFAPERFSQIPSTAFRPFGNGKRSCIGQNFAMVEATLLLALILQQFDLIDKENYQLQIMETMTIKPDGFRFQVRPRRRSSNGLGKNSPNDPMTSAI